MSATITRSELAAAIDAGTARHCRRGSRPAVFRAGPHPGRAQPAPHRGRRARALAAPRQGRGDRRLLLEHPVRQLSNRTGRAPASRLHERPQIRPGQAGLGGGRASARVRRRGVAGGSLPQVLGWAGGQPVGPGPPPASTAPARGPRYCVVRVRGEHFTRSTVAPAGTSDGRRQPGDQCSGDHEVLR